MGIVFTSPAQAQFKIMPLGNSLTYDNDTFDGQPPTPTRPLNERIAYRKKLHELLTAGGYDFDFVGSENAGEALFSDGDNAGFPGIEASHVPTLLSTGKIIQNSPFLYNKNEQVTAGPYLDAFNPDIILLHIGTNNVANTNPSVMGDILNEIEAYAVRSSITVTVFMALIIKENPNNAKTQTYNSGISSIANGRSSNNMKVIVVDMENGAGIDYTTEMVDRWHINNSGYEKMAQLWFDKFSEEFVLVGLEDEIADNSERVKVFPNPTESKFTIQLDNTNWSEFNISIYDVTGKEYKHTTIVNQEDNSFEMSLEGFPSGQYIVRLVNNKRSIIKKVIKF